MKTGSGATADDQTTPGRTRKKISSGEVAKVGSSRHRQIAQPVRQRMKRAKQMLDMNQTRRITEPCPTTEHCRDMRHGPFGRIQEALNACLPTWALLGISFVGR